MAFKTAMRADPCVTTQLQDRAFTNTHLASPRQMWPPFPSHPRLSATSTVHLPRPAGRPALPSPALPGASAPHGSRYPSAPSRPLRAPHGGRGRNRPPRCRAALRMRPPPDGCSSRLRHRGRCRPPARAWRRRREVVLARVRTRDRDGGGDRGRWGAEQHPGPAPGGAGGSRALGQVPRSAPGARMGRPQAAAGRRGWGEGARRCTCAELPTGAARGAGASGIGLGGDRPDPTPRWAAER